MLEEYYCTKGVHQDLKSDVYVPLPVFIRALESLGNNFFRNTNYAALPITQVGFNVRY